MTKWWQLNAEQLSNQLKVDVSTGLNSDEAKRRLVDFGFNQLKEKKQASALVIFLEQFKDFIIWVLIAAALISGFLKEWADALAIIAIVILNAILGFIQEFRAERSLAALKKLSAPNSRVIRNAQHVVIPSHDLVPGDIVELEAGDSISADSRIIWHTSNFSVQESSLTGESTSVAKTSYILEEDDVPLADRANMLYMGTIVTTGKARGVVVDTGMLTELGKICGMVQEIRQETTPLQKKLEEFGKWIVYLCFALVGLVFILEWLRGGKLVDVFLTAVSLAVAAIPEGLPAVVTIA
ncbi:MAG: cation-transporting P-type ATPase, partial [Candidatus Omnitrophica bacterium]|nr:cation-transporting P-type ATPase [Candidatus Omnitrophota bacterium]